MEGLLGLCKSYGTLTTKSDVTGKAERYYWDFLNDRAVNKNDVSREELNRIKSVLKKKGLSV